MGNFDSPEPGQMEKPVQPPQLRNSLNTLRKNFWRCDLGCRHGHVHDQGEEDCGT